MAYNARDEGESTLETLEKNSNKWLENILIACYLIWQLSICRIIKDDGVDFFLHLESTYM